MLRPAAPSTAGHSHHQRDGEDALRQPDPDIQQSRARSGQAKQASGREGTGPAGHPVDVPDPRSMRFALHTVEDIRHLPPPEWLINGWLGGGAQGVLYGPSGHGKTFVALDWALCVASGRPWQRRPVKQGPVVYVVAEGGRSVGPRVAAWMQEHGVTHIDNAFFVLEAVQLRDQQDHELLISQVRARVARPALFVIDTFARSFVGGDENSSKDVGEFIDASRRLHDATGAAVLLVHHTGKKGDEERGSSALRASADAMFSVSQKGGRVIRISNDKQKDAEACPPIHVRLQQVRLAGEASGTTSCVVVTAEGTTGGQNPLSPSEQRALRVLRGVREGTASSAEWRAAIAAETGSGVSPKTFDNWRRALIARGSVTQVPGKNIYQAVERQAAESRTENANAIATPVARQSTKPNSNASTATTP